MPVSHQHNQERAVPGSYRRVAANDGYGTTEEYLHVAEDARARHRVLRQESDHNSQQAHVQRAILRYSHQSRWPARVFLSLLLLYVAYFSSLFYFLTATTKVAR